MVAKVLTSLVKGCKNRIYLYPKLFKSNSIWSPRIAKNITHGEKRFFEKYINTKNTVGNNIAGFIGSTPTTMRMYNAVTSSASNQSIMQLLENLDDLMRLVT